MTTCRASKYQKHNLKYPPYRTLYTARTEIPPLQLHVTLHGPPGRYRLSVGLTKDGTALAACSTVTDCAIPCTDRVLPRAASAHLVPTLPQHTHTSTSASSRAPRRREETVGPKRAGQAVGPKRGGRWSKVKRTRKADPTERRRRARRGAAAAWRAARRPSRPQGRKQAQAASEGPSEGPWPAHALRRHLPVARLHARRRSTHLR